VARAGGRLTGDSAQLATAASAREQAGSRYERACTRALIPSRLEEAGAELDDLGVPMPRGT
jgi:hypothetical protein